MEHGSYNASQTVLLRLRVHRMHIRWLTAGAFAGIIALSIVSQAYAVDEVQSQAHKRKGIQYQSKGLLAKAVAEYQQAIELNPTDASSHNNLGLALKDM